MKAPRPSRNLIYGLLDPRDQSLRYVGKTHKRRELRLAEHLEAARSGRSSHLYNWIREVLEAGFEPEIFVLERVPGDQDWEEAERRQIAKWRSRGTIRFPCAYPPQTPKSVTVVISDAHLTNMHDGGNIDAEQ